jgi:hypothetical protein
MSEVKVNKISPRSGTTVTLGDSGDTFTIPSGATINNQGTATNFGATGSASWTTTVKTSGFTAVAGEGYFVDTSSGAVSVNLPAGTAGAVVAFKDYLNSFDTHNLTLVQNGSDKIGGSTDNSVISEEGIALTLVFIDSTRGWLVTDSGLQSEADSPQFVAATGGNTVTTCGNFKIHTFTGPGTFCVSSAGNPLGSTTVDYLVVAGGGGGGYDWGGGGGGGGVRASATTFTNGGPSSPRTACVSALPVAASPYPVGVGGGGAAGIESSGGPGGGGQRGNPSSFAGSSTITSTGGGGGAGTGTAPNMPGGSGGGARLAATPATAGTGNTPPVNPSQGENGGNGGAYPGNPTGATPVGGPGGGGGFIQAGQIASAYGPGGSGTGGVGGAGGGFPTAFGSNGVPCGSYRYYAGGGGGGDHGGGGGGAGGLGGGGAGGSGGPGLGNAGTTNTGGGGGGAPNCGAPNRDGGAGGSGIVVIRYKFQ